MAKTRRHSELSEIEINEMSRKKRVVFVTGTRADFGKIKSLLISLESRSWAEIHVFVTGMHLLELYGSTWNEVVNLGVGEVFKCSNQSEDDSMEKAFGQTASGFASYIKDVDPDLVVIHGDRLEALACASVAVLAGHVVAHIEGGELSGTIDESIRHAVTKLSHLHFVANHESRRRLVQMGENDNSIIVIGSPDIDVMNSDSLPTIDQVKSHYQITFDSYAILLIHPVTTELDSIENSTRLLISALKQSGLNYLVVLPNNDTGSRYIRKQLQELAENPQFRVLPSLRFEYFLTALKESLFIIGNSSAGIREAPHFGVPTINIGTRQNNRGRAPTIYDVDFDTNSILNAVTWALSCPRLKTENYGKGTSGQHFVDFLERNWTWQKTIQKNFVDFDR